MIKSIFYLLFVLLTTDKCFIKVLFELYFIFYDTVLSLMYCTFIMICHVERCPNSYLL